MRDHTCHHIPNITFPTLVAYLRRDIQSGSVIHALRPIPYSIYVSILFIVNRLFSSHDSYPALTSALFFILPYSQ